MVEAVDVRTSRDLDVIEAGRPGTSEGSPREWPGERSGQQRVKGRGSGDKIRRSASAESRLDTKSFLLVARSHGATTKFVSSPPKSRAILGGCDAPDLSIQIDPPHSLSQSRATDRPG